MKQVLIIMMTLFIGFHNPAEENTKTIKGNVSRLDNNLPLEKVKVSFKGYSAYKFTDSKGNFEIEVPQERSTLSFSKTGYLSQKVLSGDVDVINVSLESITSIVIDSTRKGSLSELLSNEMGNDLKIKEEVLPFRMSDAGNAVRGKVAGVRITRSGNPSLMNSSVVYDKYKADSNESYANIDESGFKSPWKNPHSTLSIDVDAAAYSNVRRFINSGQLPPKDAVKIEEMINYFTYDYHSPRGNHPFGVEHEVSVAPWNRDHQLVHIGIQGERIEMDNLPPSNIVFLLDVSGSMGDANKLPLLKKSLKLLVNELRAEDRVAIVVYAGAAGEVLASTPGNEKRKIIKALDHLNAGGSTAGGAGIKLAYKIAQENFIEDGNNRIILATDGDFNVGASSDEQMEDLIEKKRESGVFLTVLGYGMGNYKDSKMEILADKGNGNHAYIDNILEAKKVLVNEFGGTLFTIAKDVKIQVEFNPATVQAYRLIGYENRRLNDEDFNNDKKDAGELGSGHSVTALYEVIPVGVNSSFKPLDDLKYRQKKKIELSGNDSDLMTVKLRYKMPDEDKSILLDTVIKNESIDFGRTSNNFRWSAAVAGFGMLLRDSDYKNDLDYKAVISLAKGSKGKDEEGYRAELIKLIQMAELLGEGE